MNKKTKHFFTSSIATKNLKINSNDLKSRQGTLCIFYGNNAKINSNNNNKKNVWLRYTHKQM